jgi:hypothetical protein
MLQEILCIVSTPPTTLRMFLGPLMNMEMNMGYGMLTLQVRVDLTLAISKHIANPSYILIGCQVVSYNP